MSPDPGLPDVEQPRVACRHHRPAPQVVRPEVIVRERAREPTRLFQDQRTGGVTHKIDPDVDQEREFVAQTLGSTGLGTVSYITPTNPLLEARTATGGEFHSDGRIAVITLKSTAK